MTVPVPRWLLVFLCAVIAAYTAEHIAIFYLNDRNPMTLEACPAGRTGKS